MTTTRDNQHEQRKNRENQKAKEEAQKAAGGSAVQESSRERAVNIGEVVWKGLLHDDDELEGTSFMEKLKRKLESGDYEKLRDDIKKAFLDKNLSQQITLQVRMQEPN